MLMGWVQPRKQHTAESYGSRGCMQEGPSLHSPEGPAPSDGLETGQVEQR